MQYCSWFWPLVIAFGFSSFSPKAHAAGTPPDPQILTVQTLLREEQLYPGEATGILDKDTESAIRHYQMLHELRVTGVLDRSTRSAMHLPETPVPEKVVQQDQQFLHALASAETPLPPVADAAAPQAPKVHAPQHSQPPQTMAHRSRKSRINLFGRHP